MAALPWPRVWPLALLAATPAFGQEQTAQQQAQHPARAASVPVYEMVAGDRETAWRINRMTGEVMICRMDTTGSLDAVRARCAPASFDTTMHQPPPAPGGGGGGRP